MVYTKNFLSINFNLLLVKIVFHLNAFALFYFNLIHGKKYLLLIYILLMLLIKVSSYFKVFIILIS